MRRLLDAAVFTFGPLKKTGSILTWAPTVIAVLGVLATAVGVSIPTKVGGLWLAVAGLTALCLLLLWSVYRMHRVAFPDFPPHKIGFAYPMLISKEGERLFDLLLLELSFTSRHTRRMSLEVTLFYERVVDGQVTGPHEWRPETGPLGSLELLEQPIEVEPDKHVGGKLAFRVYGFLFKESDVGEALLKPDYRVRGHLVDNVSGAETDVALPVQISD